jgi:pilus assembly protein Flp/PilA
MAFMVHAPMLSGDQYSMASAARRCARRDPLKANREAGEQLFVSWRRVGVAGWLGRVPTSRTGHRAGPDRRLAIIRKTESRSRPSICRFLKRPHLNGRRAAVAVDRVGGQFVNSLKFSVTRLLALRSRRVNHAGFEASQHCGGNVKRTVLKFLSDESGATAIEYGLIAAGISLAIIVIVNALGANLNTKFTDINSSLK